MRLIVYNMDGKNSGEVDFPDDLVIKNHRGAQALTEAVTTYRANQRAGTASTLTKGTVAGSGKKPWRQKGTGNARAGYRQSPVWRGGGVVFGPKPRDYSKRMPKRVARLALQRALSDRVNAGDVMVVEAFTIPEAKTRHVATTLKKMKADTGALLILDAVSPEISRAARNLPKVQVVSADNVNIYQIVRFRKVIVSKPAMALLEKRIRRSGE
jgi:large subunit ribosomal protein L4